MNGITNRMYGCEFNKDVMHDLKDIEEKINTELEKEDVDREKLLNLRMQKLLRGMELGGPNTIYNRFNGIAY